jgi:two-component system sensor kinase FixL
MRRRGAIGTAVIDPVEVQQVVVNLVTNALDAVAGRPDARIEIATGREPRAFLIRVADNGPGVAPGVLPDLFKAFASGKAEGLGLGLSIAKTIAQNHGGDIEVDPGGAGRGAAFTVRLPAGGASARRPKAAS